MKGAPTVFYLMTKKLTQFQEEEGCVTNSNAILVSTKGIKHISFVVRHNQIQKQQSLLEERTKVLHELKTLMENVLSCQ